MRLPNSIATFAVVLLFAPGAPSAWAGYGDGVAAAKRGDYATALREFRALAKRGNALGQNGLGTMYAKGRGVPLDYVEAARWYRKAAEQGLARAQGNLGVLYQKGRGVSKNEVRAHSWYSLAEAQNIERGAKNRDKITRRMTPAQIAEAERLAHDWKAKHGRKK